MEYGNANIARRKINLIFLKPRFHLVTLSDTNLLKLKNKVKVFTQSFVLIYQGLWVKKSEKKVINSLVDLIWLREPSTAN